MEVKFITCSGANETTDIPKLLDLLDEFPRAEVGIQVSEKKALEGMPRFDWIHTLYGCSLSRRLPINAALHINLQWVEDFGQGKVAPELENLLSLADENGYPFISRAQLNLKIGREKAPDPDKLFEAMRRFRDVRFILSYNNTNARLIRDLYRRGAVFDLLYDDSFGRGILPVFRKAPVFADVVQGYAGGITPANVTEELDKVADAYDGGGSYESVWIDAQKGLEDENTMHFDLGKCREYLRKAEDWCLSNSGF